MNKKYYLGVAVIALLATTVGVTAIASASGLSSRKPLNNNQARMQEHQGEMKTILENGDFSSWQTLMQDKVTNMEEHLTTVKAQINEETFNNMQKMHELKMSGDIEGAKELATELGLPMGQGKMMGRGFHKGGWNRLADNDTVTE